MEFDGGKITCLCKVNSQKTLIQPWMEFQEEVYDRRKMCGLSIHEVTEDYVGDWK